MDDIQVLICDDSALMRNLISRVINETEGMNVAGTAMNGKFLLQKIPQLNPDLILLDIEMPEMTGVEFLQERKKQHINVPVVILSSIATKGAAVTMECLELGASDFITKPGGSTTSDITSVTSAIIEKIASYGGNYARRIKGKKILAMDAFMQQAKLKEVTAVSAKAGLLDKIKPMSASAEAILAAPRFNSSSKSKDAVTVTPLRQPGPIEVVAIGISTGGPNALRDVFANIDPKFSKPILVVQHMPAGFTTEFAASLDRICPLHVKEAEDGDTIHPGQVYIAPGDNHIVVERSTLCNVIRLSKAEQRNGHRPSADVLFESVAKIYQNRALGVIMTGMGRDGAAQLTEMRKQGAWTLGQDEKSSIVYGMPRVAFEMGGVQRQIALEDMANEISSLVKEHGR